MPYVSLKATTTNPNKTCLHSSYTYLQIFVSLENVWKRCSGDYLVISCYKNKIVANFGNTRVFQGKYVVTSTNKLHNRQTTG